MENKLFEDDWGEDNSPVDDTQITTTILYYSEEESKEFKRLVKKAMLITLGPETAQARGNISDIILHLLRKNYGDTDTQKDTKAGSSGVTQGEIPFEG